MKQTTLGTGLPRSADNILHISYQRLANSPLDIGFKSVFINGVDYHQVTRDITVSIQSIENHRLTNTLYINGQPVKIQLDDKDISPYYSNYIECRYVVTGHFEMEIDGEIAKFEENEVCFISSSALHRELLSTSACLLINFNISKGFFTERFLSSITLTPLQKLLRTNLLQTGQIEKYLCLKCAPSETETIKQDVFIILNEGRDQKVGYQDICRGYIIRLIDTLSTSYRHFTGAETSRYKDSLFDSIAGYMKENLGTVTLTALSEAFHYHPNFINNLVKHYTGLTYSNYLVSLRVEQAKVMLETTDLSVDEIIWLIGYHNKGFFYRKFTEITGVSPAKYRKKEI